MSCEPTDRIMQTLRVHIPGAPDPTLELELFNVMDEFLRRTNAWKQETNIDISSGETEYDLGVPSDAAVVRVMSAQYNGTAVPVTTSGLVQTSVGTLVPEQTFPDGDALFKPFEIDINPPTQIFSYAIYRPNYVTITSPPSVEPIYPFNMVVALTVARRCLECGCGDWDLPEWIFDTFFQEFVDGTMARCYAMPAKPWRDLQMAQYHGKKFRSRMAERKQEVARGFEYGVQNWHYPRAGWP